MKASEVEPTMPSVSDDVNTAVKKAVWNVQKRDRKYLQNKIPEHEACINVGYVEF